MGKRTASRRQHGNNKGKLTPRKGVKTKKARTQKPNNLKDKPTTKFSYEVLEDSSVESNSTNHTRDSNDNDKNLCRMLDSTFKSADDFYNSDSSTSGNVIIERIKKRHEFCKQKEANDLKPMTMTQMKKKKRNPKTMNQLHLNISLQRLIKQNQTRLRRIAK